MIRLLIGVALLLAACHVDNAYHKVQNETKETIYVLSSADGTTEKLLVKIEPHFYYPLGIPYGECSSGILIARAGSATGREVARRTEPLCNEDVWVVTEPTPST